MSSRDKRQQQPPRSRRSRDAGRMLCVYCSERLAVNREHVFAKCFFTRPLPPVMITVPSCRECNAGKADGINRDLSLDEEYIRAVFCMSEGGSRHPVGRKLLDERVLPSFRNSPKLQRSFVRTMRLTTAENEAGILIPNTPTFSFDMSRVERVLKKITKGLFYFYMGRPLPPTTPIKVYPRLMEQLDFDIVKKTINDASHVGPVSLGDGAITYAGGRNGPDGDETVWLFNFYQSYGACVYTGNVGSPADV